MNLYKVFIHIDTKMDNEVKSNAKVITRCIYDEICSKEKMCGDCAMDKYEEERQEEAVEKFNIDRKMGLRNK